MTNRDYPSDLTSHRTVKDTIKTSNKHKHNACDYIDGYEPAHYQVPAIPTTLDVIAAYPNTVAAYQFISNGVHGIANTRRHTI